MGAYFSIFCASGIVVPRLPAKKNWPGFKETIHLDHHDINHVWDLHGNNSALFRSFSFV